MTKRALIVIDIQNDYFPSYDEARWPLVGMEEASAKAAHVIRRAAKPAISS
jgi:nicotinamidase-related amidase